MGENNATYDAKAVSEDRSMQQRVYEHYVDDTVARIRWISVIVAVGELCLMLLDFKNGFFADHPANILNFVAELLLSAASIGAAVLIEGMRTGSRLKLKEALIVCYRVVIMLALMIFIFTDIYVRHKILGTYMVFLFVLQITPAFKPHVNWIQFAAIGAGALVSYMKFVGQNSNTVFGSMFIFVAFAVSTDFLRRYFTRQLEDYYRAYDSNVSFRRLAIQTLVALSGAVEAKDRYTKGHSQRVAEYSAEIARRLGYSEDRCLQVYYIGLMHDIGKIGVPDQVINKPGRLTDEEFAEIKKHPIKGYDILKQIDEMPGISEGARWHHERFDGRGYPDGLAGEDIPVIARIIAVADAYDAMTSNRSYRGLMPQAEVYEQVEKNAGTQFDPKMAGIMLEMIKEDTEYRMHE